MSGVKIIAVMLVALTCVLVFIATRPPFPQATGIFPQVVSCVRENPPQWASDNKDWQPILRVDIEPVRRSEGGGRIREYHVLGCTLYYYHGYFR